MQQSDAQTNRIPTESELNGLREMRGMYYHRINQLKEDANVARARHETLTARYQRQLQELEGTKCQLSFSKEALKLLEEQRKALEVACDGISARLHPIKRCPQDILQLILVETVKDSEYPVEDALSLSQVCQRWRDVARATPRLWAHAIFDIEMETLPNLDMWDSIVDLMGNVDADITFHNVDADGGQTFGQLTKKMPPFIDNLVLTISKLTFFDQIGQGWLNSDLKVIRHLCVVSTHDEADPIVSQDTRWTLSSILEPLPTVSSLRLKASCTLELSHCRKLQSISILRLEDITDIDVDLLFGLFVNLSSLDLRRVTFVPRQSANPLQSTSLRELTIDGDDKDNTSLFQAILCPHLETLRLYNDMDEVDFNALLERHSSIRTLAHILSWTTLPTGIASLHRLLSLETPPSIAYLYERTSNDATVPPLMFLEDLVINTSLGELSLKDFEEIVRRRCLPEGHPERNHPNGAALIRHLKIYIGEEDEDPDKEPWRESHLYKEAKRRIVPDLDFGGNNLILLWTE